MGLATKARSETIATQAAFTELPCAGRRLPRDRAETADGLVESCTILTTEAGPDMAPRHNRQPVILPRDGWMRWLDLKANPAPVPDPATISPRGCPSRVSGLCPRTGPVTNSTHRRWWV